MAQTAGFRSERRTWREPLVINDIQLSPPTATGTATASAPVPVPAAAAAKPLRAISVPADQQLQLQVDESDLESAAVQVATEYFDEPDDQWCVRRGWVQTDAEGRQYVTVSSAPPVVILQYVHGRYRRMAGWHQQQNRYNR